MTASEGYPRIGPINTEATRPNLTASPPADPTAGEWDFDSGYTDEEAASIAAAARTSPPAAAASTGSSEDVEALARLTYEEREAIGWGLDYGTVLQEVERIITTREAAARAEERERIAQAIESQKPPPAMRCCDGLAIAAQIAREARP